MTANQLLSLFISGKMQELAQERRAVHAALKEYEMHGWIWEDHAGARPEDMRSTYLKEVEACDIYIGLFWLGYGQYTIEEFEYARKLHKPCLIYEKSINVEQRSPELALFLKHLQQVDNPDSLTVCYFKTPEQLARQVQTDLIRLLTTHFRNSRKQPSLSTVIWNVPYGRNPFFTGREDILEYLYETLRKDKAAALTQRPQGISGLGGVGKTQIAVEYAYRYRDEYSYVFWVRADTHELLISDFVAIAELLDLPEKEVQDQNQSVAAVKRWLQDSARLLLIFDNADDLLLVRKFIPSSCKGDVLLTTRDQAMGNIAHRIEIEKMGPEEGVLLLLRRANIIGQDASIENASDVDRSIAKEIVQTVEGLPLAIDQAGAYIEETACGLAGYLNRYRTQHVQLLKRRGRQVSEHPESVATTWKLSFQRIQQACPAAVDLLRFCAFLSPDAIPEEIIVKGVVNLTPALQAVVADLLGLDTVIEELRKYSLLKRDPEEKILNIHRLVQAVLKDEMNKRIQRLWAERVVRTVNSAFPEIAYATWAQCQRYLPQVQACAELIAQWDMAIPEAARLLYQAGWYLRERGLYTEAEPLYQRALMIREKILGPEHPDTASILDGLALMYVRAGKYAQAEPLFERALTIRERILGSEHPDTATNLNDLAWLYNEYGEYERAEPLNKRALLIRERALGLEHPDTATTLKDLALLYERQGKYRQAEPLFERALAIRKRVLEPKHPDTITSLNDLAWLYHRQGKYTQAEPLNQQVLTIREQVLGPEHPETAISFKDLGLLYLKQSKYAQAELLFEQALATRKRVLGPEHPETAASFNDLGMLYLKQGKYAQAESFFQQALAIRKRILGPEQPATASSLNDLGLLYLKQSKYAQAESLFEQALSIRERKLGLEHPDTLTSLNDLGALYLRQSKYTQAERLFERTLETRERVLGTEHPDIATSLNNLALLYVYEGKYTQAEPLLQRALEIRERLLGPEHLDTAASLNDLALLYKREGKYSQAEPLLQRALAIGEKVLGPEHPDIAIGLQNYSTLLRKTNRKDEAAEVEARIRAIRTKQIQRNLMNSEQQES